MTDDKRLPLHGGDIIAASKRHAIAVDKWIDLSTGMNPEPYPIPEIPLAAFHDLPYLQDAFIEAVAAYYKSEDFLAVAGSQAAIQQLPGLLNADQRLPILLPDLGYKEHEQHWRSHGTSIQHYPSLHKQAMIDAIDAQLRNNHRQHLLLINPNNPTAVLIEKNQLLSWAAQLADGAYLIVDEAFIDLTPEYSLLTEALLPANIIVLRSFGKFFGLAGLRLGFIFANADILQKLQSRAGLWQVNGPAQAIAIQALNDEAWQAKTRRRIIDNTAQTRELFHPLMRSLECEGSFINGLFCSYLLSRQQAVQLADSLAAKGVLTRVVEIDGQQALLRIASLAFISEGEVGANFSRVQDIVESLCEQTSSLA